MTTESSLKLTEAVIDVLRGGPKKFKDLYPLLANRLPEKCPHARHDGAYTVNLAQMTWLRDVATILKKVAINNAGVWHLKGMTPPQHPVHEVKNTFEPARLNQEPFPKELSIPRESRAATDNRGASLDMGLHRSGMSLGETTKKSQNVNSEEMLKSILLEGKQLNSERYYEHCRTNHVKTFYFFCVKLSSDAGDPALSSTELGQFIIEELRRCGVVVNKQFNPQGWFGKAWTDWTDPSKNEKHFRDEYCHVLTRTGENPYFYQINPEHFDGVKRILDGIEGAP